MIEELEATAVAKRIIQSSIVLVAVNLAPLFGVVFLGWDVFHVLALFWLENVVIGVFGIARVALAGDGRGLVILVILKIGMDLGFHMREHRQLRFDSSLNLYH
jgi:hypothetical protein